MTNKKSTKKALFMSALSLLLCFSMLIGTTFAWFTDSVSSTNNIITAGNLDVELYWSTDATNWAKVTDKTNVFKEGTLWEPGHTEVVYLKVVNEGTLALKYDLIVNVASEKGGINVDGDPFLLSESIMYNVMAFEGAFADRDAAREAAEKKATKLNAPFNKPAQTLEKGNEVVLSMVVYMPESVGNEANYMTGTEAPVINLGINLYATQQVKEQDSYGNDYDENAQPVVVYNASELATALTSDEEYISVILGNDIEMPRDLLIGGNSGDEYKMGSQNTKAINVDMNGNKLNFTTTYWSVLGSVNPDTVITFKNGTMTSSQTKGTWDSYDLRFASGKLVFDSVVFEKAIALSTDAVLKNVTINETHDYYALWITAEGHNVEIDGLTVKSAGRGIKIDEQYVDAPAKVTLKVSNAIFDTNKKAAIMVKSVAGADIALSNVNVANTVDPLHEVWVDEASVAYADLVTVTGGAKANENAVVAATPDTIQSMIDKAADGEVILLGAGEYKTTINMKSGVTLQGTKNAIVGCINLNGADNVTLKNIKFDAAGAQMAYDGKGNQRSYANIISGDASKNGKGTWGLVIDGCVFSGNFASGGMAIAFNDQGRGTGQSGDITIKNCTFETTGGYYDIYTYYSGKGYLNIENNTFASKVAGISIYLGKYQSSTPIVVKGNVFKYGAALGDVAAVQAHSALYTPSFDATGNTFGG